MTTLPHFYGEVVTGYERGRICLVCRAGGDPAVLALLQPPATRDAVAESPDKRLVQAIGRLENPAGRLAKAVVLQPGSPELFDATPAAERTAALAAALVPEGEGNLIAAVLPRNSVQERLPFSTGALNTVVFYKDRQVVEVLHDVGLNPPRPLLEGEHPEPFSAETAQADEFRIMQSIVDRMAAKGPPPHLGKE